MGQDVHQGPQVRRVRRQGPDPARSLKAIEAMLDLRTLLAVLLVGGIVFGTLLLMLAAIAWQLRAPAHSTSRAVMVIAFALAALACYIRGVGAALTAEPLRPFMAPTFFESGLYLAAYIGVLAGT